MNKAKLFAERAALRIMHPALYHSEFNTCDLNTVSDEYLCALLELNDGNGDFDELSRAELLEIMSVERSTEGHQL